MRLSVSSTLLHLAAAARVAVAKVPHSQHHDQIPKSSGNTYGFFQLNYHFSSVPPYEGDYTGYVAAAVNDKNENIFVFAQDNTTAAVFQIHDKGVDPLHLQRVGYVVSVFSF